jgi:glycosidase
VIVQRDWKKLQIHEVGLEAKGFKGLEDNLERYRGLGVNCLYIMGGLERDNG